MRASTKLGMLATVVLIALFVVGCGSSGGGGGGGGSTSGGGGGSGSGGASASSPTDAAKAFFAAAFNGDDVTSYLCTSNAAQAKAISQGMSTLKTTLSASGAKIDTSGLTFTAGTASGDTTPVTVGGKLKMTVSGTSTESDFPSSAPIQLKNEGGSWKVCG